MKLATWRKADSRIGDRFSSRFWRPCTSIATALCLDGIPFFRSLETKVQTLHWRGFAVRVVALGTEDNGPENNAEVDSVNIHFGSAYIKLIVVVIILMITMVVEDDSQEDDDQVDAYFW